MVLEADAKRLSAVYVVKTPTRERVDEDGVRRCSNPVRDGADVRRSYRKAAPSQTVAQVAASSAEVVDVSYGGVRLKVPSALGAASQDDPPFAFDIVFPQLDLSLHAARIWTSPDRAGGGWFCGVDISGNESHELAALARLRRLGRLVRIQNARTPISAESPSAAGLLSPRCPAS